MENRKEKYQNIILLSLLSFAILAIRIFYTHKITFIFLIWNLLLAWIPLLFANQFFVTNFSKKIKLICLYFGWLFFFPNAFYLVTDFIHFRTAHNPYKWLDLVLLLSFSLSGIALSVFSFSIIQDKLALVFSKKTVQFHFLVICIMNGYGIYLGRFLRWNSWDLLLNPQEILLLTFENAIHPIQNLRPVLVTASFGILLFVLYKLFNGKIAKQGATD
jgi:uncharacterized membrane protein